MDRHMKVTENKMSDISKLTNKVVSLESVMQEKRIKSSLNFNKHGLQRSKIALPKNERRIW